MNPYKGVACANIIQGLPCATFLLENSENHLCCRVSAAFTSFSRARFCHPALRHSGPLPSGVRICVFNDCQQLLSPTDAISLDHDPCCYIVQSSGIYLGHSWPKASKALMASKASVCAAPGHPCVRGTTSVSCCFLRRFGSYCRPRFGKQSGK